MILTTKQVRVALTPHQQQALLNKSGAPLGGKKALGSKEIHAWLRKAIIDAVEAACQ